MNNNEFLLMLDGVVRQLEILNKLTEKLTQLAYIQTTQIEHLISKIHEYENRLVALENASSNLR